MGKRKSARKPPPKRKNAPLDKVFDCLYCSHEKCVSVRIHKSDHIGELNCKKCGVSYQTRVSTLSAPVDVYAEWLDEAEKANERAADQTQDRNLDRGGTTTSEEPETQQRRPQASSSQASQNRRRLQQISSDSDEDSDDNPTPKRQKFTLSDSSDSDSD